MKKIALLPILLMLMPFVGVAQLSIDSILTYQTIQDDSVFYGEMIEFDVHVSYNSSEPYTGEIYLMSGVDTGLLGIQSIDTIATRSVVNFSNDTLIMPFSDQAFPQNGYKLGGNIVVVWPVAPEVQTVDSFRADIYVMEPLFTGNTAIDNLFDKVEVYPNPFENVINIKKLSPELDFKYVRILNYEGKYVMNAPYLSKKIDVAPLPKGFYILEIITLNGERLRYKLVKNGTANQYR